MEFVKTRGIVWVLSMAIAVVGPNATASDPSATELHSLAHLDFDGGSLEAGPATYQLFQNASGGVGLTHAYRYSGYRAMVVRDTPGDGDFPELQGYFPSVRSGRVVLHFAIMFTEPPARMNVALAGPGGFGLVADGIAFHLRTRNGAVESIHGGQPWELFEPVPFEWYVVDATYRPRSARLDVRVADAYGNVHASLEDLPAAHGIRDSLVDKYSFIGDLSDRSDITYLVDDIEVRADSAEAPAELAAPARRKLFVDAWDAYHRRLHGEIRCIPSITSRDFGIDVDVYTALAARGLVESVLELLEDGPPPPLTRELRANRHVAALHAWRSGCRHLRENEAGPALDRFEAAQRLVP